MESGGSFRGGHEVAALPWESVGRFTWNQWQLWRGIRKRPSNILDPRWLYARVAHQIRHTNIMRSLSGKFVVGAGQASTFQAAAAAAGVICAFDLNAALALMTSFSSFILRSGHNISSPVSGAYSVFPWCPHVNYTCGTFCYNEHRNLP